MPKLKLRSLQEAMTCIQDTQTHSFTEGDSSLFSHISNPTSSTSTSKHSNSAPDIGDDPNNIGMETLIPRASTVSSHRFFFSPHTTKSIMEEAGHGRRKPKAMGAFREERATTMAMASSDPYRDFRKSMEEMVEAHGIQEWPEMQELLHCYLRLNDRRTHSTILLAFVDLLMCRIELQDN